MNLLLFSAATLWFTVDLSLAGVPTLADLIAKGWESAETLLKPIFIKKDNVNSPNQVVKVSWYQKEKEKGKKRNPAEDSFKGFNNANKPVTEMKADVLDEKFRVEIKKAKDAGSNELDVVKLVAKAARCLTNTLALVIDDEPRATASDAIAAAKEEAKDTAACLPPINPSDVLPRDIDPNAPPGQQALITKGWTEAEEILKTTITANGMKARWNNEKGLMEGVKGSKAVSTLKRVAMEAKLIQTLNAIPHAELKLAKRAGKCVAYCVESAVENGKETIADIIAEAKTEKDSFISCYNKRQEDGSHY